MNKDDDVDKNKVGALNSKAKQYSDMKMLRYQVNEQTGRKFKHFQALV